MDKIKKGFKVYRMGPDVSVENKSPNDEIKKESNVPALRDPSGYLARFEKIANGKGTAIALHFGGERLSYSDLNFRSYKLATVLQKICPADTRFVGLHIDKSIDAIVCILAILKAGFGYVPIDANLPKVRKYHLAKRAGLQYVITVKGGRNAAFSRDLTLLDLNTLFSHQEIDDSVEANPPTPSMVSYVLFTSGTTGEPKGVSMPYEALSNLIDWQSKSKLFSLPQNTLQFASFGFDVSFQEIFTSLCSGGTLVIASEEQRTSYTQLAGLIESHSVDRVFLPFSILDGLLGHLTNCGFGLKTIVSAGEPLYLSKALKAYCGKWECTLVNHYGPTESHVVTQYITDLSSFDVGSYLPIGEPVDNTELIVVDMELVAVGVGVPGELVITGSCLANGYINDDERTNDKFIDVVIDKNPVRGYLTGDLVRRDEQGCFHYIRRIDDQIKINGIRVEPKEIENKLCSFTSVDRVVVLCEKKAASYSVLAFVKFLNGGESLEPLKLWAKEHLPVHMLPNRYVFIKEFPVTGNGKVDTNSLLDIATSETLCADSNGVKSLNPVEGAVSEIWERLLMVANVGINDSFFELGGSSLLAMRMFSEMDEIVGGAYSLADIFKFPTIDLLLKNKPKSKVLPRLNDFSVQENERYRASFAQLQMWIESEKFANDYTYNTPIIVRLEPSLCRDALEKSFRSIISQHLVLSSIYKFDGSDLFQLPTSASNFSLSYQGEVGESEITSIVDETAKYCFSLDRELPIRVLYLDVSDGKNLLLINIHHIAVDEWSHGILLEQLDFEYRKNLSVKDKKTENTVAVDLRYALFSEIQRRQFDSDTPDSVVLNQLLSSTENLKGNDADLGFQCAHVLDGVIKNEGKTLHFELATDLSLELVAFSKEMSISLYSCLLGVYILLLHRLGGKKDITVGTPVSMRDSFDTENVIGCFLNTIVVRMTVDENEKVSKLFKRTAISLSESIANKDIPFEKIVETLELHRTSSGGGVFSTMFVMRESYSGGMQLFDSQCQVEDVFLDVAKFDLTTFAKFDGDRISLTFEYKTSIFDEVIVSDIATAFEIVAHQACTNPSSLIRDITVSNMSDVELGLGCIDEEASLPTVHDALLKRSLMSGDSIAIRYLDSDVSYAQLSSDASRIAGFLHHNGVRKGDKVGLLSGRKVPAAIASMLGIFQLGAVYVPLDGNSPKGRIQYVIDDAKCCLVLVDEIKMSQDLNCRSYEFQDALKTEAVSLDVPVFPYDLASLMYTSGSTGNPKGVMISHQGITRLALDPNYVFVSAESRYLHLSPAAFDASTFELWLPLLNGGVCVQYPFPELQLESFGEFLSTEKIDTLWLTSSLFNTVIDTYPESLIEVTQLLVGGEALSVAHINKALKLLPDTQIINGYGPTENTTFTCCYPIPKGTQIKRGSVPVGRPIQNTSVFILNENFQPLPLGIPGELYVGGKGVALGYLNLATLSDEKFVDNAFSGTGKLYATGDYCRVLSDGNVEFIGRKDGQLKIHGRRIELAEIELAIDQYDGVLQVHVAVTENPAGHSEILAFVVPEKSEIDGDHVDNTIINLRKYLAERLPAYMVPSYIHVVTELFLTLNGKVDRCRLIAEWESTKGEEQSGGRVSKKLDDTEIVVIGLIAKSLGLNDVSLDDNFFELGGNSLLAIKLMSEIYRCVGLRLVLSDFFSSSTISELIAGSRKDLATHTPISLLFSDTNKGKCVSVFHNISLAKNVFNALVGDSTVFGLLCAKHSEIVRSFDDGKPIDVDLREFVQEYYELLIKQQPNGPYIFVGHSYGGLIAFELASYMRSQGKPVECVYLLDTILPSALKTSNVRDLLGAIRRTIVRFKEGWLPTSPSVLSDGDALLGLYAGLITNYAGPETPYNGKVVLVRSCESVKKICKLPDYGWSRFLASPLIVEDVEGDHFSIIESDNILPLVSIIERDLNNMSEQIT